MRPALIAQSQTLRTGSASVAQDRPTQETGAPKKTQDPLGFFLGFFQPCYRRFTGFLKLLQRCLYLPDCLTRAHTARPRRQGRLGAPLDLGGADCPWIDIDMVGTFAGRRSHRSPHGERRCLGSSGGRSTPHETRARGQRRLSTQYFLARNSQNIMQK